ncbi:MAG TPA: OmpA family protein [Polyangia bacterium]|jgi:OOP family OmpA-OmpF porin
MLRSQRSWPRLLVALALTLGAADVSADELKQQRNLIEAGVSTGTFVANPDHQWYGAANAVKEPLAGAAFDLGLRGGFFPFWFAGAELELGSVPTRTRDDGRVNLWVARAHVVGQWPLGRLLPRLDRLVPFAVAGLGFWKMTSDDSVLGRDTDTLFHWGVGAKYYLKDYVALRADVRQELGPGLQSGTITAHYEVLVGASYVLGWKRRAPVVVAAAAPVDSDGDGVPDTDDKCPTVAGPPPTGCPPKDTDGDGVPDDQDKCPTVKGPPPTGCPPVDKDKDTDGDGVPDFEDKCPLVAGAPPDGCPADTDGDGVTDDKDLCPSVKGPAPDGCPEKLRRYTGAVQGIDFKDQTAELERSSHAVLDGAAAALKEFRELKLIIRGHTDNHGNRDANMALSLQRAERVKAYLVRKGIKADRLRTAGVGPDEPLGDNAAPAGRARNQRIEFKADLN